MVLRNGCKKVNILSIKMEAAINKGYVEILVSCKDLDSLWQGL